MTEHTEQKQQGTSPRFKRGDYILYAGIDRKEECIIMDNGETGDLVRVRVINRFPKGTPILDQSDYMLVMHLPADVIQHIHGAVTDMDLLDAVDSRTKAYHLNMGADVVRGEAVRRILDTVEAAIQNTVSDRSVMRRGM